MEARTDAAKLFNRYYEHMRLTYVRATGDTDRTVMSIESDISQRNFAMGAKLQRDLEAVQKELRVRTSRMEDFNTLREQEVYVNRKRWQQHMITPTRKRLINYVPRDIPVSITKRRYNQEQQDIQVKRP